MNETALSELSGAKFATHQNTRFRVRDGGLPGLELELIKVELPRTTGPAAGQGECFSLLFSGPVDRLLPQAIYTFEHAVLGRFAMFIVPVSRDQRMICYEAVFNRK
jgi:hypothetical protein